jgi:hypothetical protein
MKMMTVLYDLQDGKTQQDMDYYFIPTDWNTHIYTVLCPPSHIACECRFKYSQSFHGQSETWADTHEYLSTLFTELVFKGIIKEFELKNEFIDAQ